MRALAITGMVTDSWISLIFDGSAIRATPPSLRMSAGTRSSAITATAPASSAILASSAVVTSMMTPPLSISARPLFTRMVASSDIGWILAVEKIESRCRLLERWNDVDPRGAAPRLLDQPARELEAHAARVRAGRGEPLLHGLGDRDPGNLVVEAEGELEARQRPD